MKKRKSQVVIDFYIIMTFPFLQQYHMAALNQLILYLNLNIL